MELGTQIESILFFKGEAVSIKQLSDILNVKEDEIREASILLKNSLQNRGIVLITKDDRLMLGTSPEMHNFIESIRKDELSKDLGKASLETLSLILYKGPVSKSEIDYIRGVNSSSILRNLLVRGLIERKINEENQRSFLYLPTFELLSFLGISDISELPEYESVKRDILEKEDNLSEDMI